MRFALLSSALGLAASTAAVALPGLSAKSLEARQCGITDTAVAFTEFVTTQWGDMIFVVGSIPELGNWDPSLGVPLSASNYSTDWPQWNATVAISPGTSFSYKYINVLASTNDVSWEGGSDRWITVPCSNEASVTDRWQSNQPAQPSTTTASVSATNTPVCTNAPSSRSCWSNGYSIDTDFDKSWPDTGRTVSYNFDITNMTMAPDGVQRSVFAINGQYPGPTVYANWGDMVSITVQNNLADNDGVPGVTECPIAPGQSRTYTFQATQYGTSWYHSHFSCQYGDGIVGPIVIHGPATENYDIDSGPLPITDWYYPTVNVHAAQTQHVNALPPTADNGLINGTMTSPSGGSYARTTLTAGRRHRIRLINVSVDNHFMVSLDNHQFQVISSDFVPIESYNTTWIFLGIGQRYDVIVTADQSPGSYWFRAEVQDAAGCGASFANGNIRSIFSYEGHEGETPISTASGYTQRCTDEQGLTPYFNSYVPTGIVGDFSTLTTAINQSTAADGTLTIYWQVNGTPLRVDWGTPTLEYVRTGNTNYPQRGHVIELPDQGVWTYWVIEAGDGSPFTVDVPHPVHLHGHDFYVLGTGTSGWTQDSANGLNYQNPTRRDVAMLPSGGWLAIAFQTDNPGAWLLHCHIAWHADEGFAVQFLESKDQIQNVDPITSSFTDGCNAWNGYYPNNAFYAQRDSGI